MIVTEAPGLANPGRYGVALDFLYGAHLRPEMAEGSGKNKLPQDFIAEIGMDDLYQFLGIDFKCTEKEVSGCCKA